MKNEKMTERRIKMLTNNYCDKQIGVYNTGLKVKRNKDAKK